MRKMFLVFSMVIFCLFITSAVAVFAEEQAVTDTQEGQVATNIEQGQADAETNWKEELNSDKQEIQEQKQEISENAETAREEESQLRQQIKAAMDSGDTQTAKQLKEQLKTVHQKNLQEKIEDNQEMQAAKKELKSDINEAREEGFMPPKRDQDNNPPGPKGGPGTNWENKPGPQGGPGAGPDRKPGMGNPPGPKGGPGAGPDRKPGMGNPPGPKGGPGAGPDRKPGMGNPPGPKGGPGAGPGKPQGGARGKN